MPRSIIIRELREKFREDDISRSNGSDHHPLGHAADRAMWQLVLDAWVSFEKNETGSSQFLGCLAGTVKFGPGWDDPLPSSDWDALR